MRIIAGKAGRIAIAVPRSVTRPTSDFVRQALFSILGPQVESSQVLDLYAGSGAVGLEALSRGAASCVFVDENIQACTAVRANLAKAGLEGGRVVKSEVMSFLRRDAALYQYIFADPPYWKHYGDKDHVGGLLASGLLVPRLAPDGCFIAETGTHQPAPAGPGLTLADRRTYGGTALLFYQLVRPTPGP